MFPSTSNAGYQPPPPPPPPPPPEPPPPPPSLEPGADADDEIALVKLSLKPLAKDDPLKPFQFEPE